MKPIIIIGDKEKTFSAEELKKYVEEAYSQGYADGYKDGDNPCKISLTNTHPSVSKKSDTAIWDSTKITCQTVLY